MLQSNHDKIVKCPTIARGWGVGSDIDTCIRPTISSQYLLMYRLEKLSLDFYFSI